MGFGFLIVHLLLAIAVAYWAYTRGRNPAAYFLLACFCTALLASLVLWLRKDLAVAPSMASASDVVDVPSVDTSHFSSASVADELTKLAHLRDTGVLTAEEFETQKKRLLNA